MFVQVCVNGSRRPNEHPRLSPDANHVAADAAAAVAAGAEAIHLHPKDASGHDSLTADDVARWVAATREACPGVSIGVTTGEWAVEAERAPELRARLIRSWERLAPDHLPDFASVNWHEAGAEEVASILLDLGVGAEAGVWHRSAAQAWGAWPQRMACLRVLVEIPDVPAAEAERAAVDLVDLLQPEAADVPLLLHGEERSTWPTLRLAQRWGLDTRIGLEDTLTLPDGSVAPDNAALVRAAVAAGS